jgi:hypothetical protein
MSASNQFTVRQSSDEKKPLGVRFIKKEVNEIPWVIQSVDITAFDEDQVDVTSTVLVTAASGFTGNQANFRTNAPTVGNYQVRVKATMTDGSVQSAWGLVIVVDPILGI